MNWKTRYAKCEFTTPDTEKLVGHIMSTHGYGTENMRELWKDYGANRTPLSEIHKQLQQFHDEECQ